MAGYSPPWSEYERGFLIKNHREMTAREVAAKLNKSIYAVKAMRRKWGLKKGPRYRWPSEKVINKFKFIIKNINRIPTYNYLESDYPGLLVAIQRDYGNYNNFLSTLKIKPNLVQNRWSKEKCIREFKRIMKEFNFDNPPPIKRLNAITPGILRAIYRHWGTYKNMLKQLNLHPNFERKWSKRKCIREFQEIFKRTKNTPTVEMIQDIRPDLLGAIFVYCGSYNKLLAELNIKPNQEKWDKNRCIREFQNLMKMERRVKAFSIEDLYRKHSKLLGAIYRYFKGYNDFLIKLGYEPNYGFADEYWQDWENFVIECCKQIYKSYKIMVKKRICNGKIPDLAIIKNGEIYKIIDAKTSVSCISINEDIENYKLYCDILEFWCLVGKRKDMSSDIKFLNADDIKDLLTENKFHELVKKLSVLKGVWYDR